ncbi:MAG: hypothetical protein ABIJ09_17225 [Pseudomonadota bacterium]
MNRHGLVALAALVLPALLACPHRVEPARDARYTTNPVCPGAVRKSDFDILRAGFSGALEHNEIEALQEMEQAYLEYADMAVAYPTADSATEAARYRKSLGLKRRKLDEVVAQYQPFVDSPRPELAVMSLYRIGEAHELLAVDIENTRVPAGSSEAQLASFCSDLFDTTRGLRATAQRHFARCTELARKSGLQGSWAQACQRKLGKG